MVPSLIRHKNKFFARIRGKQGQKLSKRTEAKDLFRSEGLEVIKNHKILNNLKVNFRSNMYNLMKKLCLHDISIHTNFHTNRSINECT